MIVMKMGHVTGQQMVKHNVKRQQCLKLFEGGGGQVFQDKQDLHVQQ